MFKSSRAFVDTNKQTCFTFILSVNSRDWNIQIYQRLNNNPWLPGCNINSHQNYSHNHAEHDEDVPQSDEDPEVSQAEQELSDVVAWETKTGLI